MCVCVCVCVCRGEEYTNFFEGIQANSLRFTHESPLDFIMDELYQNNDSATTAKTSVCSLTFPCPDSPRA